jgi:integrase
VVSDQRIIEGRFHPALGKAVNVRTLTAQVLAQYEKRRAGQVSAYTVANELSVLRHMLRLAKRWGYVATVPEVTLPKKPEGRRRFLAEEELRRLLAACEGSRNPHLAAIVTVAVHTGMRKGELLGLEWERIDLASARIVLYDTKNGAPRGVPMNRAVYDVLMRLGPTAEERTGLVFRRRSGLAWGQIRRAFDTAVTKAAIPDFRFHDLRHTAASHMVMRGASLKDVQEVLGHKDFKMTLRYAHLSPAHLRGAVERLEGLASSPPAAVQPSGQGVSRGSVPSRFTGTVER